MNAQQWLAKLIAYNTISSESNKELIDALASWFSEHDIQYSIIPAASADKLNLFATLAAEDGSTQGGLLLSGHTDVVPVEGQLWDSDPFCATEQHGAIYGRGACDMKGFIAVVLALLPELCTRRLVKPIHFAFTCDEEIGCIGVDYLVDYLREQGIRPEGCIVGEPSSMRPIIGEKGRRLYHVRVEGKAVHSSQTPHGCNAVEYASRLISYISDLAAYIEHHGPFDADFDLPFTTITTNLISGGSATNIVPGQCEFVLEVRYTDNFLFENFRSQIINYINDDLLPQMKKSYEFAAIHFDMSSDGAGFSAREQSPLLSMLRTVTGIKERYKVSYSTEAGSFEDYHIPTVICGPGSIEQAHRPNEFITLEQLSLCDKVLRNIIALFCQNLT